jgi:xylulokinase
VFGAPTGAFMGLTCFANGSLARERIRDQFGLTWSGFSEALRSTPPGNDGRMLLPWFVPEITPLVLEPQVRSYALAADDGPGHVRAVVEAQMLAMALHSSWMGLDVRAIHATGGGSENAEILRVMADVFGAEVRRFDISNSAALGAAMRAWHADARADGEAPGWDQIVSGTLHPMLRTRVEPDPAAHNLYRDRARVYAEREAAALR